MRLPRLSACRFSRAVNSAVMKLWFFRLGDFINEVGLWNRRRRILFSFRGLKTRSSQGYPDYSTFSYNLKQLANSIINLCVLEGTEIFVLKGAAEYLAAEELRPSA